MKRLSLFLLTGLLLTAPIVWSQAAPAGGGWVPKPSTWNVAVGGSYLGTSSGGPQLNLYGWSASISEYPYASLRWVGGTIEASGDYSSGSRSDNSNGTTNRINVHRAIYTYAGGPSVTTTGGRVRPFAHALFGAINTQTRGRLNGSVLLPLDRPSGGWPTHAGMLLGGGFDIAVSSSFAIRGQADWVQVWAPSQAVNCIRATTGAVYRF